MNRQQILQSARLAGQLRRYHTWSMHHTQTVAEHSWQCMRIYYQIWGNPPAGVYEYFLWHDAGEIVTGDLPFPFKSENRKLKKALDEAEESAVVRMGGPLLRGTGLSKQMQARVKACDLIEMHETGTYEVNMGNRFAWPIVKDTATALSKLQFNKQDWRRVLGYLKSVQKFEQAMPNPDGETPCT